MLHTVAIKHAGARRPLKRRRALPLVWPLLASLNPESRDAFIINGEMAKYGETN